jgi:hypothetical protein
MAKLIPRILIALIENDQPGLRVKLKRIRFSFCRYASPNL